VDYNDKSGMDPAHVVDAAQTACGEDPTSGACMAEWAAYIASYYAPAPATPTVTPPPPAATPTPPASGGNPGTGVIGAAIAGVAAGLGGVDIGEAVATASLPSAVVGFLADNSALAATTTVTAQPLPQKAYDIQKAINAGLSSSDATESAPAKAAQALQQAFGQRQVVGYGLKVVAQNALTQPGGLTLTDLDILTPNGPIEVTTQENLQGKLGQLQMQVALSAKPVILYSTSGFSPDQIAEIGRQFRPGSVILAIGVGGLLEAEALRQSLALT